MQLQPLIKFRKQMLIKSVNGKTPLIPEDCYVAENATIVGDVSLENLVVFGLMLSLGET
jgi:carbonic anhydrase/acetyltransferase-like protein (isoleucine patch superfamily)